MRLHPYTVPIRAASRAIAIGSFGFFVGALLIGVNLVNVELVFVLAPLGALLGASYGVAEYYRFEYELAAETFDVASGVFARREREIPYGRIQNVDISRSVFQRLVGVAVVRIETAGGGETEAVLSVVGLAEARRLQSALRERARSEAGPTDSQESETGPVAPPASLFQLHPNELAILCLVSIYPGAVVLITLFAPVASEALVSLLGSTLAVVGLPADLASVIREPIAIVGISSLIGATVLAAGWIVSGFVALTGYYGFELRRSGDDLEYERGLLQRHSGSIPIGKIQRLTISEPLLARLVGYSSLRIETAGYAPGTSSGQGRSIIGGGGETAVPIAASERVGELAATIDGFHGFPRDLDRPPKRARRRYAVRYMLGLGGAAAALWLVAVGLEVSIAWWTPLWFLPLAIPAAHLKWRHRGIAMGDHHLVVRSGFWHRRTRVVPFYRVQAVFSRASLFQRRLGLADLTADTASSFSLGGGHATAFDIDSATADREFDTVRARLRAELAGPR